MNKQTEMQTIVFGFASAIMTLLLSCNVYFIKHLVDRIDQMESTVWQLRQDVVVLQYRISEVQKK